MIKPLAIFVLGFFAACVLIAPTEPWWVPIAACWALLSFAKNGRSS